MGEGEAGGGGGVCVEKIMSFRFLSDARQPEGDEIAAFFAYVFGHVISIKDSNYYEFGSVNRQDILKRKTLTYR